MRRLLPLLALCSPLSAVDGDGSILHISEQQFRNGHVTSRSFKNEEKSSSKSVPAEEFSECSGDTSDSFHNYYTEDLEKENNISLSDYRGNVLLVVNLASFWGFTPQYYSLNALGEEYADQPFKVLGFPCAQFLNQEPGANASEILGTLKYIRPGDGFVPNFQQFAKTKVNGEGENTIYTFLKKSCDRAPRQKFYDSHKLLYEPKHGADIRWNFEKFLIDHNGIPIRRYRSRIDPLDIVPDIDRQLAILTGQSGIVRPTQLAEDVEDKPSLDYEDVSLS